MNKKQVVDDCGRIFIVIVSSAIYALGVIWFLEPAGLYGAGVTGISQIVRDIFKMGNINVSLGVLAFVLNIPLFVIGLRHVSLRFTIYSALSVVVQSVLMLGFIPVVDFGINPVGNELTFSIVGGLVTGFGCGLALRYGTSTGGLDIVAQAYAFKKNLSIGSFTLTVNVIIAVIGGGLLSGAWAITLYTFIRIIISSVVVDKIHTVYNYSTLNIITSDNLMAQSLMKELKRGCTLFDVHGAYTHEQRVDLYMVVSSYEIEKATRLCKRIDPNVFIVVSPVKKIVGNFFKRTII